LCKDHDNDDHVYTRASLKLNPAILTFI